MDTKFVFKIINIVLIIIMCFALIAIILRSFFDILVFRNFGMLVAMFSIPLLFLTMELLYYVISIYIKK